MSTGDDEDNSSHLINDIRAALQDGHGESHHLELLQRALQALDEGVCSGCGSIGSAWCGWCQGD